MAEIILESYEILEGELPSPVRVKINGEEMEVIKNVWETAYDLVTNIEGMGYPIDDPALEGAVFEAYIKSLELAKDVSEEVLETEEPVVVVDDLPPVEDLSATPNPVGTPNINGVPAGNGVPVANGIPVV